MKITDDMIRAQYARNAEGLFFLYKKAIKSGGKCNGRPADFWLERATFYKKMSLQDLQHPKK
jgi:hypothetical protein